MGLRQWAERHQLWQVNPHLHYRGDPGDRRPIGSLRWCGWRGRRRGTKHSRGTQAGDKRRLMKGLRQAWRQDSVTAGGRSKFWGAREVYLCEFERGTGARKIYSSVDQTNKVKTEKKDLQFKNFHKFWLSSQNS